MQARLGADWTSLYRFDLSEQYLADYEVTNWYLANHPESHFVQHADGWPARTPTAGTR